MKKTYISPVTLLTEMEAIVIMAATIQDDDVMRKFSGGPADDTEKPFPTNVSNASDVENSFDGHGQGAGGDGTRAKGSMWDDFDEEW